MDAAAGKAKRPYFKLQVNARASDPRTVGLVVHEFMLRSASTSMMLGKKDRYMIHQSWVAAPYPPSVAHVAPDLFKKAEEYAKITYRICIGEDDTFDDKYGKLAHQAMFEGRDLGEAFQSAGL